MANQRFSYSPLRFVASLRLCTRYSLPALVTACLLCAFVSSCEASPPSRRAPKRPSEIVTVTIQAGRSVGTFRPDEALGAGVDGMEEGDVDRVYTAANIAAMRSAGLKPLTYRLRTELGVEAWHWNPRGAFSDAERRQGYWTSNATPGEPILTSNGYALPRRGSSGDQANNRGYSRIDDGDPATFWKSSPYLDRHYTSEENSLHPQWILVDFARKERINAIRTLWGEPYARRYRVEYWQGRDPADPGELPDNSGWALFAKGDIRRNGGGDDRRALSPKPVIARWIRILMTESSGKALTGSRDPRDGLGYAVRELSVGIAGRRGEFLDLISHVPKAKGQTRIYVSSTDPWHGESDLDRSVEQPGFDRVYESGLTNGLPVLMPVGLLYDTPENAAAQIRWLRSRGYPLRQIEVGEEPDGQFMTPEDYGALYIQWADAIHAVDPSLKLGGPGFQTALYGWQCWPDARGNTSWMNRFMAYLKQRKHVQDFNFFSFEWYPFDKIGTQTATQLAMEPALLENAVSKLRTEGVPTTIPWIITEYGYSSFAGQPEMEMPGALLNAEIVAQFLTLGGAAAYLYGYEPNVPILEDGATITWGNLALFLSDNDRAIRCPLPTFHGAVMLAQCWAQPGHGLHKVYRATGDCRNVRGEPLVTAYTVQRPDGRWAVMLLNKDPARAHRVRVALSPESGPAKPFPRSESWQYGPAQYRWLAAGAHGHPVRNKPPVHAKNLNPAKPIDLPPYSMTVLRTL